jgi:hypothetical protein
MTTTNTVRPERLRGPRTGPDGQEFPWGPIDQVHEIGPYQIVEYRHDMSRTTARDYSDHGRGQFHPFIDGKDTSQSFDSLDAALVGAIAYRHEGPDGSAAYYFMRMLGEGGQS